MEGERAVWSMRIDEAEDLATLERLDAELRGATAAWAGPLRFKIGQKKVKAKARSSGGPNNQQIPTAAYGMPAPDGRWLYRYRLSQAAFDKLEADLIRRGSLEALGGGHWPALFVLWAAEWFRRCYDGGGHRWGDLVGKLGVAEDQTRLRQITAAGLRAWGRPVRTAGSAREFLGSLAREGGFPTAAIQDGGRGWAQDLLKAVVAPMLGDPTAQEDRARELAYAQRSRTSQLFRDDEFLSLCADLAFAIVALRRRVDAPAANADLPTIAWLELHEPSWRDQLPITTGERAADALLASLMSVEAAVTGSVGVKRLLVRGHAGWGEGVIISLDGLVDGTIMRAIDPAIGRLRAFAAGEMARTLPGELAMFDPPVDGSTSWSARGTRRTRQIQPVRFNAPVELDLRSGERSVARIQLPGGKPRRGPLLVCVAEEGGADDPSVLRVVGSGSGQHRAETVFVQVPTSWSITATMGEAVESIGRGTGESELWRVSGGAYITEPSGDCYRIRCGQAGDQVSRIELHGPSPRWAELDGDVDLFVGAPVASLGRAEGSLCIRELGERAWRPAPRPLPTGHYEIGWRNDRILLDRRRVAVLPAGADLIQGGSPQSPTYDLSGWSGCRLAPAGNAPVEASSDGSRWRSRRLGHAVHWFDATISWPDQPDLAVRINHPCAASLARWDGRILPDRTQLTLEDLRDLVAVNRGRVQLVGELVDRGIKGSAEMSWEVVDELPMASIAVDIASMLLPASIDSEVRLGMHDGIETYWYVRQFAVTLEKLGNGVVASRGVVTEGAELVGRSLAEPTREVSFGRYSLLSDSNHRPAQLPAANGGAWLVYLRAGEVILSRPLVHLMTGEAPVPDGRLAKAMVNLPGPPLDDALLDTLQLVEGGGKPAREVMDELLALLTSLRGLPPATFRVLELLVRRPGLLARLALAAGPEQREAVLALSDSLPFAWATIPRHWWEVARREAFERNREVLSALGAEAARYAKETLDAAEARLIELEPLLGPVLKSQAVEPIEAVAQAFMNRAVDRVAPSSGARYRSRIRTALPAYFERFDERYLDTLDAPCAAALAVSELWTPQHDDIRHIKAVARAFPTYFADAYAATLKETH